MGWLADSWAWEAPLAGLFYPVPNTLPSRFALPWDVNTWLCNVLVGVSTPVPASMKGLLCPSTEGCAMVVERSDMVL